MADEATTSCPGCQRLQTQRDPPGTQRKALQATMTQLQEQLAAARKNSSTSSKPPSSDIVKPAKPVPPGPTTPRSAGGQPGHVQHLRALFEPHQIQESFDHRLDYCPDCGHQLRPTGFGPHVVQQVEVPKILLHVEEHRQHEGYCCHCDKTHYDTLPLPVQRGGLLGLRLTTLVAYQCH